VVGVLQRVFVEFEWRLNQATRFGWKSSRRALTCEGSWDLMHGGVIRELAVGVEWGCEFDGRIGRFGFERRSGWKYVGNRRTWHVLWRLASRRL
jgi:hypothetical protein